MPPHLIPWAIAVGHDEQADGPTELRVYRDETGFIVHPAGLKPRRCPPLAVDEASLAVEIYLAYRVRVHAFEWPSDRPAQHNTASV